MAEHIWFSCILSHNICTNLRAKLQRIFSIVFVFFFFWEVVFGCVHHDSDRSNPTRMMSMPELFVHMLRLNIQPLDIASQAGGRAGVVGGGGGTSEDSRFDTVATQQYVDQLGQSLLSASGSLLNLYEEFDRLRGIIARLAEVMDGCRQ